MRRRSFYRRSNGKDEARLQEAVHVAYEKIDEESESQQADDDQKADEGPRKAGLGWQPCPHCGRPSARYFHILWCKDNPERGKK